MFCPPKLQFIVYILSTWVLFVAYIICEHKLLFILHIFSIKPSKHLLVFKSSWRRLQDMSWRCLQDMSWGRLQHAFSVTIFCLPGRLEYILQDVFKTFWKTKNCYAEDVLETCLEDVWKTCLEDVFKMSWRQANCLLGISVSNKSIFNKSISGESKANPKCIN